MEEPGKGFSAQGEAGTADTPPLSISSDKETEVGYELPSRRDNYLPHQRRYI